MFCNGWVDGTANDGADESSFPFPEQLQRVHVRNIVEPAIHEHRGLLHCPRGLADKRIGYAQAARH